MPHVELPSAEFKVSQISFHSSLSLHCSLSTQSINHSLHSNPSAIITFNPQVVLLGDTNTGKTCLVLRFVDGSYKPASRSSTIGAFFLTKRLTVDHITAKVLIWDTAGQEKFQKLTVTYYQNAAAAILCFDVSNPAGLQRLRQNLQDLAAYAQEKQQPLVTVVAACKCDLMPSATATRVCAEAKQLAALYQATYRETSAKNHTGVTELFHETARLVLEQHTAAVQKGGPAVAVTVGSGATPTATRASPRLKHNPSKEHTPDTNKCDSSTENESDGPLDEHRTTLPSSSSSVSAFHKISGSGDGYNMANCDGNYLSCGMEDVEKGCVIL